jgi:hypothetical protein
VTRLLSGHRLRYVMTTLIDLQRAIDTKMRGGATFSTVEDDLIEPSRLSDEAKSALWLYAWSFVGWQAQRREAHAHITQLAQAAEATATAS